MRRRPRRETAPPAPLSPYGTAKLAGEEYLRTYNRLHGTTHVSLRYGNVYGPRQDPHGEAGVVAIFLGALARGEQARIFGDGLQTRDYVYVGDVARATVSALGQEGGVFNVGTGRETSVVDLYELCRRVAGSTPRPCTRPRASASSSAACSTPSSRPRARLRAMVELEDGLQATWEWLSGDPELARRTRPRRRRSTAPSVTSDPVRSAAGRRGASPRPSAPGSRP